MSRTRSKPAAAAADPAPGHNHSAIRAVAPLRLFELGEHNVRKTYEHGEVLEMAADIKLRGLKLNLVVEPSPNGGGRLAVVAGGRRLRALWYLADEGDIDLDYEVPYLLEDPATGRETSLAENIQKVSLNPVDEIEAFAQIVADHHDQPDPIAYCAQRVRATRHHVEQQLRLADLPAMILDALRDGRIDVAAARAYAMVADQEARLAVFAGEERRGFGPKHVARTIRDTLRGRTYPEAIAQARYVGLDAYRAAGGRSDRELFLGADEGERLLDPALLDRLARDKAEAELPARAAADGLAAGVLALGFNLIPSWPKPPATHVQRRGVGPDQLAEEERKLAIGVYGLAQDGSGLELAGLMTAIALPAPEPPGTTPAMLAVAPAPAPAAHGAAPAYRSPPPEYRRETPAEAIARTRDREVRRWAALLAVRKVVAGMLPADRLVLPDADGGLDVAHEPVEVSPDGDILVTIQVRVRPEELEAMRADAERGVDAPAVEEA